MSTYDIIVLGITALVAIGLIISISACVMGIFTPQKWGFSNRKEAAKALLGAIVISPIIVLLVPVLLGFEPPKKEPPTQVSAQAKPVAKQDAPKPIAAPAIGRLSDKRGHSSPYSTKVIQRDAWGSKWPFHQPVAVLVCVPDLKAAGGYVVANKQPWAVTGFATTFARIWELKLTVDGVDRDVQPLDPDKHQEADRVWARSKPPAGWDPKDEWAARVPISPVITALEEMGCGGA